MIIDTTTRKPVTILKKDKPVGGNSDQVDTGDIVEVEIIRNGKTLYKGR